MLLSEADILPSRNDDMVLYGNPEDFAGLNELRRQRHVLLRWRGIAAGVVVYEHHACCTPLYSMTEALSRMCQ